MDNPFISFLITTHNEDVTLKNLIERLELYLLSLQAEIVIIDDHSDNLNTLEIFKTHNLNVHKHSLNKDYSAQKNYGKSMSKSNWIFQIDADELPSEFLLQNLKELLELNPTTELFYVPRVNDFKGITEDHAKKWGWKLSDWNGKRIVNFPDFQTRIFKNLPHIEWKKKLHERIEGAKTYAGLPFEMYIYHDKTIEQQEKSNEFYNRNFTVEENMGISNPK